LFDGAVFVTSAGPSSPTTAVTFFVRSELHLR
jgi:hypothetical protein